MAFNGVFGIIVIGAEHLFCEFQTRRHLYERDFCLECQMSTWASKNEWTLFESFLYYRH
jgi:hypothetical protein